MKNKILISIIIIFCILGVATSIYTTSKIQNFQVIEKSESTRLQYTVGNNGMSPNFIKRYYIILRNYDTGIETKLYITEEEYNNFYVLGDTIHQITK